MATSSVMLKSGESKGREVCRGIRPTSTTNQLSPKSCSKHPSIFSTKPPMTVPQVLKGSPASCRLSVDLWRLARCKLLRLVQNSSSH